MDMSKMEGLRAGVAEMRSVAQRLNQWANLLEQSVTENFQEVSSSETSSLPSGKLRRLSLRNGDLEALFRSSEADATEVPASEPGPVSPLTLPEVRAILAEKCAAGFGTQVKALIESYGASSLKGVPADKYGELLEAVKGLGDADAG